MNRITLGTVSVLGAGCLFGITACALTPDGQISEIEGAVNGAILEVWSQTATDHVEIAVVADHECDLGEIYFDCLRPGDVLGRPDVPRYQGTGFDEESNQPDK